MVYIICVFVSSYIKEIHLFVYNFHSHIFAQTISFNKFNLLFSQLFVKWVQIFAHPFHSLLYLFIFPLFFWQKFPIKQPDQKYIRFFLRKRGVEKILFSMRFQPAFWWIAGFFSRCYQMTYTTKSVDSKLIVFVDSRVIGRRQGCDLRLMCLFIYLFILFHFFSLWLLWCVRFIIRICIANVKLRDSNKSAQMVLRE